MSCPLKRYRLLNQYPEDTKLHHVLKAAVSAGTTTDPTWAGALVEYQDYAQDFVEFSALQTIIGRFGQGISSLASGSI